MVELRLNGKAIEFLLKNDNSASSVHKIYRTKKFNT